jgi:hypothetical protein
MRLAVLALFGAILTDICLLRFRKIPFTCSWLPGKSRINMAFFAAFGLLLGGSNAADVERRALQDTWSMLMMLAVLGIGMVLMRRAVVVTAQREKSELQFEEEPAPQIITLQLSHE